MRAAERALKTLVVGLARFPGATLVEAYRRFQRPRTETAETEALRSRVRSAPLILQVETTNACNAECVFCAYPRMKRKKGVMSLSLFEQLVAEYAAAGGGPVSLTPVVGDALLDPHLLERLAILERYPQVSQVSLTTNGIALHRYSDREVRRLLEVADQLQVSIGGLDAQTYKRLYGCDRFGEVREALQRLLALREEVPVPAGLSFAFRTDDWRFELRFRKELGGFRRRGVFVSHIWNYANYAGVVHSTAGAGLCVLDAPSLSKEPCIYPSVHIAVCWDGRITACGCADFEADALPLGWVGEGALAEVWTGPKRQGILDSFVAGRPPGMCRRCSAYQADSSVFSRPFCRGVVPHSPLPADFYRQFWGG